LYGRTLFPERFHLGCTVVRFRVRDYDLYKKSALMRTLPSFTKEIKRTQERERKRNKGKRTKVQESKQPK
jgi:hypothetical protein